MPRSRSPYEGVLAKPIVIQPNARKPTTIVDLDKMDAAAQARFDADLMERRAALYRHFGIIDDESFESAERLAMALACEHVPGMKVAARRSGRPRGGTVAPIDVFRHVEAYREERFAKTGRRPMVGEAIRDIRRRKAKTWGFDELEPASLRNLYTAGRKEEEAAQAQALLWRHARWRRAGGARTGTILDVQVGD